MMKNTWTFILFLSFFGPLSYGQSSLILKDIGHKKTYSVTSEWERQSYETKITIVTAGYGPRYTFHSFDLKKGVVIYSYKGIRKSKVFREVFHPPGPILKEYLRGRDGSKALLIAYTDEDIFTRKKIYRLGIPSKVTLYFDEYDEGFNVTHQSRFSHYDVYDIGFYRNTKTQLELKNQLFEQFKRGGTPQVFIFTPIERKKGKPSKRYLYKIMNDFVEHNTVKKIKEQSLICEDKCHLRAEYLHRVLRNTYHLHPIKVWKFWRVDNYKYIFHVAIAVETDHNELIVFDPWEYPHSPIQALPDWFDEEKGEDRAPELGVSSAYLIDVNIRFLLGCDELPFEVPNPVGNYYTFTLTRSLCNFNISQLSDHCGDWFDDTSQGIQKLFDEKELSDESQKLRKGCGL